MAIPTKWYDDYTKDDCRRCQGTGIVLANLTQAQDAALAKAGKPIPKVECPRCKGTGFEPKGGRQNVRTAN